MKCPNCGYEGETRFCPECGTPLEEMNVSTEKVCPRCGQLTDAKFCPNCGNNMNAEAEGPIPGEPAFAEEKIPLSPDQFGEHGGDIRFSGVAAGARRKSHRKTLLVILIVIAAVIIAAIIAFAVIVRGFTDNQEFRNSDEQTVASEEMQTDDADESDPDAGKVADVQDQGRQLPGGTYTVGEDIDAGRYNFTYITNMSEDDYWSNDYFWITRAGSEGSEETLGGTRYDERFGAIEYSEAKAGKTFYANLKKGDKVVVDSDYGSWTY